MNFLSHCISPFFKKVSFLHETEYDFDFYNDYKHIKILKLLLIEISDNKTNACNSQIEI